MCVEEEVNHVLKGEFPHSGHRSLVKLPLEIPSTTTTEALSNVCVLGSGDARAGCHDSPQTQEVMETYEEDGLNSPLTQLINLYTGLLSIVSHQTEGNF